MFVHFKLTPTQEGSASVEDVFDSADTNGKLVLPLVYGECTLTVEPMTQEQAREFRKVKDAPVEPAEEPEEQTGSEAQQPAT